MITPRPYISFSSMALFEKSPEQWANIYLRDYPQYTNKNMRYGSLMADSLEKNELSGDPALDLMIENIPKFELIDKPIEANLKNGKDIIIVLAKPDTAKADYTAFKEYKTSLKKWTQKIADDSDQITFYATTIWLKTNKIPQDIELVNVQVKYTENGELTPTGELIRIPTIRTMIDIIKMITRIRKNWTLIQQFCEKELL